MKASIYFILFVFSFSSLAVAETNCSLASKKITTLDSAGSDAKKVILEAISLCPQSSSPKYSLAIWYQKNNDINKSLNLLKKLNLVSKKPEYALAIGRGFQANSKYDQAIDWYNEAVRRDSKKISLVSLQALQGLGAVYLSRDEIIEAEGVLKTALKLSQSLVVDTKLKAHIHYNLGIANKMSSHNDLAKKEFLLAIELKKDLWQAYVALSSISKDDNVSLEWAEKAAVINPKAPEVILALSAAFEKKGQYQQALATIEPLGDESKTVVISKSVLLIKTGEIEKALISLKALSKKYPSDLETLSVLGWALLKGKYYTEAEIVLGNALALNDEHIITLENMGILLEHTGRLKSSKKMFEKSAALKADT